MCLCLEAVIAGPVGKCLDVHPPARPKPSARAASRIWDSGGNCQTRLLPVVPSGWWLQATPGYRLANPEEYLCKEEWALSAVERLWCDLCIYSWSLRRRRSVQNRAEPVQNKSSPPKAPGFLTTHSRRPDSNSKGTFSIVYVWEAKVNTCAQVGVRGRSREAVCKPRQGNWGRLAGLRESCRWGWGRRVPLPGRFNATHQAEATGFLHHERVECAAEPGPGPPQQQIHACCART